MPTNIRELMAQLDSMTLDQIISGDKPALVLDNETVDTLAEIGVQGAFEGDERLGLDGDTLTAITMMLDTLDGATDGLIDGIPAFSVLGDIITKGQLTGGQIHDYLVANHGEEAIAQAFKDAAALIAEAQGVEMPATMPSITMGDLSDTNAVALMLSLMGEMSTNEVPPSQDVIRRMLGI